MLRLRSNNKMFYINFFSVAEPEPPGADFFLVGAGSRSRLFLGGSGCIFKARKKAGLWIRIRMDPGG